MNLRANNMRLSIGKARFCSGLFSYHRSLADTGLATEKHRCILQGFRANEEKLPEIIQGVVM